MVMADGYKRETVRTTVQQCAQGVVLTYETLFRNRHEAWIREQ
jgi:hypothetical protein